MYQFSSLVHLAVACSVLSAFHHLCRTYPALIFLCVILFFVFVNEDMGYKHVQWFSELTHELLTSRMKNQKGVFSYATCSTFLLHGFPGRQGCSYTHSRLPSYCSLRKQAHAYVRAVSHGVIAVMRTCSMIDGVSVDSSQATFIDVAREIFNDGQFNWGRIVMLFYFAYKMAKKVLLTVSCHFSTTRVNWQEIVC